MDAQHYRQALDLVSALVAMDPGLDTDEGRLLLKWSTMVEAYEREAYPDLAGDPGADPPDA